MNMIYIYLNHFYLSDFEKKKKKMHTPEAKIERKKIEKRNVKSLPKLNFVENCV